MGLNAACFEHDAQELAGLALAFRTMVTHGSQSRSKFSYLFYTGAEQHVVNQARAPNTRWVNPKGISASGRLISIITSLYATARSGSTSGTSDCRASAIIA